MELPASNRSEEIETDDEFDEEINPFTDDELSLIKKAIKGNKIETLYQLSIGTGVRQGEALALTQKDLDFNEGTVRIVKNLANTKIIKKDGSYEYKLLIGPPKTKSSRRVVQIPENLVPTFRMTERIYIKVMPAQKEIAVNKLNYIFS